MGEERLRERLCRELAEGTPAMRLRAAARLVERLGSEAAAPLEAALGDAGDPELRAALVERLAATENPRAFSVLRQHLHDLSAEVRAAAAAAVVRLAPNEAERDEALSLALADGDARVRRRALIAATCLRGIDAGPWVAALTADEDRHCRRLACIALSSTRDPVAALALVEALRDEDEGVRQAAEAAARRLFGEKVGALAGLSGGERGRAIARLRAWVASHPPSAWDAAGDAALGAEAGGASGPGSSPLSRGAAEENTRGATEEGSRGAEEEGSPRTVREGSPEKRAREASEENPRAAVEEGERGASAEATTPLEARHGAGEEAGRAEEGTAGDGEDGEAAAGGSPDERARWTEQIELTLRAALRGATLSELVEATQTTEALLSPWVETLVSQGKIVRRGRKFYFP